MNTTTPADNSQGFPQPKTIAEAIAQVRAIAGYWRTVPEPAMTASLPQPASPELHAGPCDRAVCRHAR